MKTIRSKLFVLLLLFMAAVVVFGAMLNNLFLEKFYIYKSQDFFYQQFREISALPLSDEATLNRQILMLDRRSGISTTILDRDKKIRYSSQPEQMSSPAQKLPSEIDQSLRQNKAQLSQGPVYKVVRRPDSIESDILFMAAAPSGTVYIFVKPIKGIHDSVIIANQFYVFSGMLILLVGSLVVFIVSKQVIQPIVEMSAIAEEIADKRFENQVQYRAHDELGALGISINKMSEKLRDNIEQLQNDVERRKQLVRNISHELKTPIGVMKGYAEGIQFGLAENPEKMMRYCKIISNECDRMDGLVKEMLNLSMMESEYAIFNKVKLVGADLVKIIVERLQPAFEEAQAHVDIRVDTDLMLMGDASLVERALTNYLINALRHLDGERIIRIEGENRGQQVCFSVENTGDPIPEGEFNHIWEVFYKVDKVRSRHSKGHGLGLSIVRQVAELHGGTCQVQNVSKGVRFELVLPKK